MLYAIRRRCTGWSAKTLGWIDKAPTVWSQPVFVCQRLDRYIRGLEWRPQDEPLLEELDIWEMDNLLCREKVYTMDEFVETYFNPGWHASCPNLVKYYELN